MSTQYSICNKVQFSFGELTNCKLLATFCPPLSAAIFVSMSSIKTFKAGDKITKDYEGIVIIKDDDESINLFSS